LTWDMPGEDDLVLSSPTRVVPDVEPFKFEVKTEWSEGFMSKNK